MGHVDACSRRGNVKNVCSSVINLLVFGQPARRRDLLVTRCDLEPRHNIQNLSGPEAALRDHGAEPIAVHRAELPVHLDDVLANAQRMELAEGAGPYSWEAWPDCADPQLVAGRIDVGLLLPRSRVDHVLDRHELREEILERCCPGGHEAIRHRLEARAHEPERSRRGPRLAGVDLVTEGVNDLLRDPVEHVQVGSTRRDAVVPCGIRRVCGPQS
jgi:hypothetical protein